MYYRSTFRSRRERGIQRPEEAARQPGAVQRGDVVEGHGNIWINVDRLVLVQAEHVNIFRLDHRFRVDGPGIPAIPLLGNGVAVARVHEAARGADIECARGRRNGRHRVHTITPVAQQNAGARHGFAFLSD